MFDEGRITDSKGRTVDAKNAIFIMTSNLQQKEERRKKIGFIEQKEEELKTEELTELNKYFRPEFINRIDEQIVFRQLKEDDVRKILDAMLDELTEDLKRQHNIALKITEDAVKFIADKGYSQEYGVRELRRTVEKLVQIPLSNMILSGKLKSYNLWQVVCSDKGISIVPAERS